MRRRDQWIEWMRAVERESDAAAYAIELLDERLQTDPSSLTARGLERRDADHVKANREATYLVRLFAVFESGLRDAWLEVEKRATEPKAADCSTHLRPERKCQTIGWRTHTGFANIAIASCTNPRWRQSRYR